MSIAVIGLGGAGGNIANESSLLGIPSGAINFSSKDLDSIDVKHKLKVMGSEGVGHDRNLAISLMHEHYPMVIKFVKDNFSNPAIEIIFLPFASGGGSGSGIAPMLAEILMYEMTDKVIVPMPIIPDESEVLTFQENSYNALSELSKLNLCILPIDNNEVKKHNKAFKSQVFDITNKTSVSLLHKLVSYTEKASKNGNFDNRDLLSVFSQKGMSIISEVDITSLPKANITSTGIAESIFESWETSIFAPIEYDQVAKCAFIFDGQESIIEHINYEKIFSKFDHGVPIDILEGYYEEHNGKIITALTGLPWCVSRMNTMDSLIESSKVKAEAIIKTMENEHQFVPKTHDFSQKLRQNSSKSDKNVAVLDILSKYKR
jgi:cell division GTPase FtsZ